MNKLTACSLGALALLLMIGGPRAFAQSNPNEQINQIGQPATQKQTSQPTQPSQSTSQTQPTTQKQKIASRRQRGPQPTTEQQIQRDIKQYVPQQYQQYLPAGAGEGGGGGMGGSGM